MAKKKTLQTTESRVGTTTKPKPKLKPRPKPKQKAGKKRREARVEWLQLFRFSILLILVGIIVFHYYLITEQALLSFYQSIWNNHKKTLSPILLVIGYSVFIFLIGFWVGKKKK